MNAAVAHPLIAAAPKVVLHDHLDGGLRPATAIELARAAGYAPLADAGEAAAAAMLCATGHSLAEYLSVFTHSTAVLQDTDALARVAAEAVVDLVDDGVCYAELRFAPELHQRRGLTLDAVIDAVCAGVRNGATGRPIEARVIVTAMRTSDADTSTNVAAAAVAARTLGVVGFDLAGNETGHPATAHRAAITIARRGGLGITLHAGETGDIGEVARALELGADRIGHGTALIGDIGSDERDRPQLGSVISDVISRRIHIEACPTSNVDTGAVANLTAHPAAMFAALGASLSVHADNRTASDTTATGEAAVMVEAHGWGVDELENAAHAAIDAAFCDADTAAAISDDVIEPGYRRLREALTAPAL